MKKIKRLISELLMIGVILLFFFFDLGDRIPKLEYWILGILIILSSINLVFRIRFRSSKNNQRISFKTKNDSYYKVLPIIIGVLIIFTSTIIKLIFELDFFHYGLMILLGLIHILIGYFFIPTGLLKVEKDNLKIIDSESEKEFKIKQIEKIDFYKDYLSLIKVNGETFRISHLDLSKTDLIELNDFFNDRITNR